MPAPCLGPPADLAGNDSQRYSGAGCAPGANAHQPAARGGPGGYSGGRTWEAGPPGAALGPGSCPPAGQERSGRGVGTARPARPLSRAERGQARGTRAGPDMVWPRCLRGRRGWLCLGRCGTRLSGQVAVQSAPWRTRRAPRRSRLRVQSRPGRGSRGGLHRGSLWAAAVTQLARPVSTMGRQVQRVPGVAELAGTSEACKTRRGRPGGRSDLTSQSAAAVSPSWSPVASGRVAGKEELRRPHRRLPRADSREGSWGCGAQSQGLGGKSTDS